MRPIALILVVTLAGCSWTFVREARPGADCTSSHVAPNLDVVGSVASFLMVAPLGLTAAYLGKGGGDGSAAAPVLGGFAVGFAVTGLLYALSAHEGYRRTGACRSDEREQDRAKL